MNALTPIPSIDGAPEAFREYIAEMLSLARIHAGMGEQYAEIGDDIGLEYAVRHLTAYARQAVSTLAELKQNKAREVRP